MIKAAAALQKQELDDEVHITKQLLTRPRREVNHVAELRMLKALVDYLPKNPSELLQKIVDLACEFCEAGSAGISILERQADGKTLFRWVAMSGAYKDYVGGTTPLDDSPCGTCLDLKSSQLYSLPGRVYSSLSEADPVLVEGLVIPIPGEVENTFFGTIWIAAHDDACKFDVEDMRLMTSLASFTSSAMRTQNLLKTEQLARKAADDSANFISSIVESSPDCVKVIDIHGRLLSMNENGCKQMEIGDFDVCVMQPWLGFWEGEHLAAAERALAQAREGQSARFEGFCATAMGTPKWWEVIVAPIKAGNGNIIQFLSISRDITERREAEQAVRLAQESAESANLAKTEFLANMSHEIRTPMNAIIGLTNILVMSDPLTSKQKEYLKTLQMSADTLLSLVNDLLDIAKIEARSVELEEVSFSLTQIVQEVISMMAVRVREKGLTFTADGECVENRMFMGDPSRLRQVILNLCSNAIKFTDHGNIHVSINCGNCERPDAETIHIAVTDTGIGIAPSKLDTIFQKFTQADSSINRKYGGTGLGLAITKTLVEIMGGGITVVSELGKGSSFTVNIPLTLSREQPSGKSPFAGFIPVMPRHMMKDVILLVEDYAPNVMVAQTFLEQFGYTSEVAADGQTAVNMAKTGNFALIIMDVQMHGMNGLDATMAIRKWESETGRKSLPIMGMTAHALSGDRERCISVGMDEYISKPFNTSELEAKIKVLLSRDS